MGAFVVILPEESEIQTEDVEGAFRRRHELIADRAWLVWHEECDSSEDACKGGAASERSLVGHQD